MAIAALAALVALVLFASGCSQGPRVRVIRGVVAGVNYDGSAMFLGSATKAPGYLVPQNWEDMHGVWHESGHPDCALPLSSGARAELHVINVPATKDAPGFPDFAVRIRCLSRPTLVRKP